MQSSFSSQSSGSLYTDGGASAPMAEINTTPMVDVMLVLLVIFIITAPLMTSSIPIDLPKSNTATSNRAPIQVVNISIDQTEQVYWNDTLMQAEALTAKLDEAAKQSPQPEVHIRADKSLPYQALMNVMTMVQGAGIQKMGFVNTMVDMHPKP